MPLPTPRPPSPLRAARQALGYTLEDVSAAVGVAPSQVSRWERGQGCPPASDVCRIAEVYGLPVDDVARWFASASEAA